MKFKKEALEAMAFLLHKQGKSAEETYEELLNITGRQEILNLEEIKVLFVNFGNGKYGNLMENEPEVEKSQEELEELMYEVLAQPIYQELIAKYLDVKSRVNLLETSELFKQFTESAPLHIKNLSLTYTSNRLTLNVGNFRHCSFSNAKVEIRPAGGPGERSWSGPSSFSRPRLQLFQYIGKIKDFTQETGKELQKVLNFPKLLTIGTLKISEQWNKWKAVYKVQKEVFGYLESTVKERKSPLKVDRIVLVDSKGGTMMRIFALVEPGTLKAIKMIMTDNAKEYNKANELSRRQIELNRKIFQSDHWKNLKKFTSVLTIYLEHFMVHYLHFSYCKVRLQRSPDVKNVVTMKDKLLENPDLQQYKIKFDHMDRTKFNEINKIFGTRQQKNPVWAHFDYPGDSTDKKVLSVLVTSTLIWFKGPCFKEEDDLDDDNESVCSDAGSDDEKESKDEEEEVDDEDEDDKVDDNGDSDDDEESEDEDVSGSEDDESEDSDGSEGESEQDLDDN